MKRMEDEKTVGPNEIPVVRRDISRTESSDL